MKSVAVCLVQKEIPAVPVHREVEVYSGRAY